MTTTTLTLAAFLAERLDEDEEAARTAAGWRKDGRTRATGTWHLVGIASINDDEDRHIVFSDAGQVQGSDAAHIARHDPARVLAEVAAKRAIIEWDSDQGVQYAPLMHLAAVYGDHPDYDESWRP